MGDLNSLESIWIAAYCQLKMGAMIVMVPDECVATLSSGDLRTIAGRIANYWGAGVTFRFDNDAVAWRFSPDIALTATSASMTSDDSTAQDGSTEIIGGRGGPLGGSRTARRALGRQPPRPRNSFIIFRQYHHDKVKDRNPTWSNNEISKYLGQQWRNLSSHDKHQWQQAAEKERLQHAEKYPEYVYNPRRPGEKKRRQTRKMSNNITVNTSHETAVASIPIALPELPIASPDGGVMIQTHSLDYSGRSKHNFAADHEITASSTLLFKDIEKNNDVAEQISKSSENSSFSAEHFVATSKETEAIFQPIEPVEQHISTPFDQVLASIEENLTSFDEETSDNTQNNFEWNEDMEIPDLTDGSSWDSVFANIERSNSVTFNINDWIDR
jgi:hypothetical protein